MYYLCVSDRQSDEAGPGDQGDEAEDSRGDGCQSWRILHGPSSCSTTVSHQATQLRALHADSKSTDVPVSEEIKLSLPSSDLGGRAQELHAVLANGFYGTMKSSSSRSEWNQNEPPEVKCLLPH